MLTSMEISLNFQQVTSADALLQVNNINKAPNGLHKPLSWLQIHFGACLSFYLIFLWRKSTVMMFSLESSVCSSLAHHIHVWKIRHVYVKEDYSVRTSVYQIFCYICLYLGIKAFHASLFSFQFNHQLLVKLLAFSDFCVWPCCGSQNCFLNSKWGEHVYWSHH